MKTSDNMMRTQPMPPPDRRTAGGSTNRRAGAAVCAACAVWACAALAESKDSSDFSFEQLTSLEVSGVSKSAERVLDAPAAVTIVTGEDIRNYGYRTLADVLNAAPGFLTTSDRAYTYVGVRGFAPIGSYNSRILLLIDGFPSNEDVYQQALIGNEGSIDLSLIDRVEIIPGPSSSVYGTNAYLGVVNVILKSPLQMNSDARVQLGTGQQRAAESTLTGSTPDDTRYFLHASVQGSNGQDVTLEPASGVPGRRIAGVDGMSDTRAFAKIVDGNLRLNLAFSDRRQAAGYGEYGDLVGDRRSWVSDGLSFADLHYDGSLDDATNYTLRVSMAEYRYDSDIVDIYPTVPALPGYLPIVGDWVDTEATATRHFSSTNRLVVGVQLRRELRENMDFSNDIQGTFLRVNGSATHAGAYAQSDVDWSAHWATSLGVRADSDSGQSTRVDPRLAILWKPATTQVLKLLWGTAYRNPSFYELNFAQPALASGSAPLNLPDPGLRAERLHTLDLDYEAQIDANVRLTTTVFRYQANNLISEVVVNDAGTLQYQNGAATQARGIDFSLDSVLGAGLRTHVATEYASATADGSQWARNSPHWSGRVGLDKEITTDIRLAVEGLYASQRLAIDNAPLAANLLASCTLSTTPRPGRPDIGLSVYNVFNRANPQPVAGWLTNSVDQPGRSWRLTLGYSF